MGMAHTTTVGQKNSENSSMYVEKSFKFQLINHFLATCIKLPANYAQSSLFILISSFDITYNICWWNICRNTYDTLIPLLRFSPTPTTPRNRLYCVMYQKVYDHYSTNQLTITKYNWYETCQRHRWKSTWREKCDNNLTSTKTIKMRESIQLKAK